MNYAIVENGLVTNIIWLDPRNAADFPSAVYLDDRPVGIGDSYENGVFTRDGEPVRSDAERIVELEAALAEIEEALNE